MPDSLPAEVDVHEDFGNGKDFILDGNIMDSVSNNPKITIKDDKGDSILILEVDVSFSNLIISSDINVSSLKNNFIVHVLSFIVFLERDC